MTTAALVPVFTGTLAGNPTPLCNARDLHSVLESGSDFSNWIKDRIEKYGFNEGEDFSRISLKTSRRGGRPAIDYHLTLDMAKELAMVENNDQGRAVRRYFIQIEKQSRAATTPTTAFPSKIDKATQDRIDRRAWALAQNTFERHRRELTQDVAADRLDGPIEEWTPVDFRAEFIEAIEANAVCLRTFADGIQHKAKMLAEMGGMNYEAIASKFWPK